MRVITWNMRKATVKSVAWKILTDWNPDVALLQEVSGIPSAIYDSFDVKFLPAITKNGKTQKFGTAILVHGKIINELPLSSEYDWVNQELECFAGNLISCTIQPIGCAVLKVISVYSPAWAIDTTKYPDIDITTIRLKQNPQLWVTEILWSALKNANIAGVPWIVGGDFNSSPTFDLTFSSGNQEILDRMEALGFTECLKKHNGILTPTFRNPKDRKMIHQIDHLFVTAPLASILNSCTTGDISIIFGESVSDHLSIIADFADLPRIPSYLEDFISRSIWVFAKTMPEIPHYYIVKDNLSEQHKTLFDELDRFITRNGYVEKFYSKQYIYFNVGAYKYWVIENILNRAML